MKINAKERRRQLRSLPSASLVLYASQQEKAMMLMLLGMLMMMLLIPRKNTSAFGRRPLDARGTDKFVFYCFKISSKTVTTAAIKSFTCAQSRAEARDGAMKSEKTFAVQMSGRNVESE